jgi:hypothetical protein
MLMDLLEVFFLVVFIGRSGRNVDKNRQVEAKKGDFRTGNR